MHVFGGSAPTSDVEMRLRELERRLTSMESEVQALRDEMAKLKANIGLARSSFPAAS
jgi:uncharacterized coiled-coil protein SlyX